MEREKERREKEEKEERERERKEPQAEAQVISIGRFLTMFKAVTVVGKSGLEDDGEVSSSSSSCDSLIVLLTVCLMGSRLVVPIEFPAGSVASFFVCLFMVCCYFVSFRFLSFHRKLWHEKSKEKKSKYISKVRGRSWRRRDSSSLSHLRSSFVFGMIHFLLFCSRQHWGARHE